MQTVIGVPAASTPPVPARHVQQRLRRITRKLPVLVILTIAGLAMLFPVLWILTTAFGKSNGGLATSNLFPSTLSLQNFRMIFNEQSTQDPVLRWIFNSVGVSAAAAVMVAVIDSLAAFALARLRFRGSKVVFTIVVSSLMVPFIALLLPLYLWFQYLGLLNTYGALVLPYAANAFGVFLLYQFFLGIPQELQDAAIADGASHPQVWWRLFVPLSTGITATLMVLTFMNVYNDFFWPLVATSSPDMRTITVGIEIVAIGQFQTNYTAMMALTVVSIIPMVIAFIFAQRRLVEGIAVSGLQG
ncbi:MAG: carbohydrate ABC transporter permease [Actinomycetota bacterium]|nr:carbohydrate ABC transporter permease [Actinomycetota bacterium]